MASVSAFKKLSHREHVIELPDTYIGSIDTHEEERWVFNEEIGRMAWTKVNFCPGFYKLFDEILVNALDHRVRLMTTGLAAGDVQPVKNIWITLEPTRITVKNDGDGIPVGKHAEYGMYVPEMIFGHLLTSSNYDKSEEKIVGGKNGYGSKLTNIFSKEFRLETVDHRAGKKYKQVWRDNMVVCEKPVVSASSVKPYTEISYVPDLSRFHWLSGVAEIPADMMSVLKTRVIDSASCAGKECKVSLNGKLIQHNTFQKYVELFLAETDEADKKKVVAYEKAGERWEVAAILTRNLHGDSVPDERHISFVNGISTRRGGKHVDYVIKTVLGDFTELAKKKAKMELLSAAMLKSAVVFFINSTIVNPAFDTQTKETLTTPMSKWGSKPDISAKFCDQLLKIGLLDEAQAALDAKNARDTKKTDGKKRSTVRGIPKLEDATWAGTAKSGDCTLILTEGDSAKTTAVSGLKVVGRERYGVFPLKGKLLNVKDISAAKKAANQEITYIKQILGLVTGKVYTDVKQLRYGRVMIMTDQDVDGSHIKGLLINLFHTDWPSLLHIPFICCMMTPLLKVTKGSKTLCFYSEPDYETWRATNETKGWKTKYYKGLGTSTATEAREYFANMNTLEFQWDDNADKSIDLAFNKKRADDRKVWLSSYDKKRQLVVVPGAAKVDYSRFIHDELIHFSSADNIRSLPSVLDGLKPSQRKILWACLKRNLVSEIKVAQLAGNVSEVAAYHHGEASLTSTIVGMAQDFVGANNINLLFPGGQFGSRLQGGSDAASPRYIHTHLEAITRAIYKKEDDGILSFMEDDGRPVEPETYFPVVPMLLINGSLGIGTGFSTDVPSHNPADIIRVLKERLNNEVDSLEGVQLKPWWHGFTGSVLNDGKGGWIVKGSYSFADDDEAHIHITELPVGTWTQDYKEFLEEMIVDEGGARKKAAAKEDSDNGSVTSDAKKKKTAEEKKKESDEAKKVLLDVVNNNNDMDVNFTLRMIPDAYHEARAYPAEFEKRFQLNSTVRPTNMVAFDSRGKIRRFASVGAILEDFYVARLDAYVRRKASELKRMDADILELRSRLKFIESILAKTLVVADQSDEAILAGLQSLGLPPLSKMDEPGSLDAFEYLLRIRIDRIKASAVEELRKQVAVALAIRAELNAKTEQMLWLEDLAEFETAYTFFLKKKASIVAEAQATTGATASMKKKVSQPKATARPVKKRVSKTLEVIAE